MEVVLIRGYRIQGVLYIFVLLVLVFLTPNVEVNEYLREKSLFSYFIEEKNVAHGEKKMFMML